MERTTMKYGLSLPQTSQYDLVRDVASIAGAAEAAGYASLWAYERVLFPLKPLDGMYGVPGLAWTERYQSTADPMVVLALAAAATTTAQLGTCVLVTGLHHPMSLARAFATLDQATGGGRVVAGLGAGWSRDEFRGAGADFTHRGRYLEEMMDGLRALWAADPVTYKDSRIEIDDALVSPKPLGRIPIVIGGGSAPKALDRIARKADGWIPSGLAAAAMAQRWEAIRESAARHGRPDGAIRMMPLLHVALLDADAGSDRAPFQGSAAQIASDIAEVAEVGAHECILSIANAASAAELSDKAAALISALDLT